LKEKVAMISQNLSSRETYGNYGWRPRAQRRAVQPLVEKSLKFVSGEADVIDVGASSDGEPMAMAVRPSNGGDATLFAIGFVDGIVNIATPDTRCKCSSQYLSIYLSACACLKGRMMLASTLESIHPSMDGPRYFYSFFYIRSWLGNLAIPPAAAELSRERKGIIECCWITVRVQPTPPLAAISSSLMVMRNANSLDCAL
jgi:hypothetical protein